MPAWPRSRRVGERRFDGRPLRPGRSRPRPGRFCPARPCAHALVLCRDRHGVVERVCGAFGNPETLAYGKDGRPARPLYRVRFDLRALWPEDDGPAGDKVEIEIFEHWLEAEG